MGRLLILGLGLLVSCLVLSQETNLSRIQAEFEHFTTNQFMGTVLIADADGIVFRESTGFANLGERSPIDQNSVFRIASLTKQFTAAAILLLQERGQLSVEDSVSSHIDELPERLHSIRLSHLLRHRSGLAAEIPNSAFNSDGNRRLELSNAQWQQIQLSSPPGVSARYSNSGYHLLGEVIESVSDVSYVRFIQENILDPLQLEDTGFVSSQDEDLVSGYVFQEQEFVEQPLTTSEIEGVQSAGGMTSTPDDLLRWNRNLFAGGLLSEATVNRLISGAPGYSALGLQVSVENGRRRIFHTGSLYGHAASLSYFPDSELSIVVLSNTNARDSGGDTEILAKSFEYILFEEDVLLPSEATEIDLPAVDLEKFVGSYEIEGQGGLSVTLEEEVLSLQFYGDSTRYPLTAVSDNAFIMGTPFIHYEFGEDAAGAVSEVVLHQRGSEFRFLRE